MKRAVMVAVLLAMAATVSAEWNKARADGADLRWVRSRELYMRLIVRTQPTGKVDVYVDFNEPFGRGELEIDGLKTVWVYVWFDDKPYGKEDWPTGVEGRSMFVPDKFDRPARYQEMIRNSKTMTVQVFRPLDKVKMRGTFDLQ